MSKERYELVTASELKVGDAIFCDYKMDCVILASQGCGDPPWLWDDIEGGSWGWANGPIFRRISGVNEIDVLRRALEIQYREMVDACIGCPIEYTTDQARRELESEAKHG